MNQDQSQTGPGPRTEHDENVMLFVFGTLDNLIRKGLVEGGKYRLSAEGAAQFDALVATGFVPTKAEIDSAMGFLQSEKCQ